VKNSIVSVVGDCGTQNLPDTSFKKIDGVWRYGMLILAGLCWNFRKIYGGQEPSRNPPGYIGWPVNPFLSIKS
jgi:hypothetical protein